MILEVKTRLDSDYINKNEEIIKKLNELVLIMKIDSIQIKNIIKLLKNKSTIQYGYKLINQFDEALQKRNIKLNNNICDYCLIGSKNEHCNIK